MTESTIPDNSVESWYSERQARLESERARVEAQEITIRNAYSNLESRWAELDRQENDAHDMVETRELVRVLNEKQKSKQKPVNCKMATNLYSKRSSKSSAPQT